MTKEEIQSYIDNEPKYMKKIIAALKGKEEMTEELFEISLLISVEEPKLFFKLIDKYPIYAKKYFEKLDAEIETYKDLNKTKEKLDNWFYNYIKK